MPTNDILSSPKLPAFRERFRRLTRETRPDDCWEWLGPFDPAGYGQVTLDSQGHKAHRVAWVLAKGPIPPSGTARSLSICHHCDNRGCVNPSHLFVGTDKDNVTDMVRKGRIQHGATHNAAKLTDDQVYAIRRDPRFLPEIAADYGLVPGTVRAIKLRATWAHLPVQSDDVGYVRGRTGRPKKPNYVAAPTGKLAHLRRAVEAMLASKEEMDDGWFVPTEAMQELLDVLA